MPTTSSPLLPPSVPSNRARDRRRGSLVGATALALVASCGGAQTPATTAPPAETTTGAPTGVPTNATGAPMAWKDMNKDQRLAYMKTVVLPKMKESFTAFDAKGFADMSCVTCHGTGAQDGTFKMPNPALPRLDVAGGFKKHMDKDPEITKFMMSKVVPQMADLLGEKPYDPKTHEGFGCFECHTAEK